MVPIHTKLSIDNKFHRLNTTFKWGFISPCVHWSRQIQKTTFFRNLNSQITWPNSMNIMRTNKIQWIINCYRSIFNLHLHYLEPWSYKVSKRNRLSCYFSYTDALLFISFHFIKLLHHNFSTSFWADEETLLIISNGSLGERCGASRLLTRRTFLRLSLSLASLALLTSWLTLGASETSFSLVTATWYCEQCCNYFRPGDWGYSYLVSFHFPSMENLGDISELQVLPNEQRYQ